MSAPTARSSGRTTAREEVGSGSEDAGTGVIVTGSKAGVIIWGSPWSEDQSDEADLNIAGEEGPFCGPSISQLLYQTDGEKSNFLDRPVDSQVTSEAPFAPRMG